MSVFCSFVKFLFLMFQFIFTEGYQPYYLPLVVQPGAQGKARGG